MNTHGEDIARLEKDLLEIKKVLEGRNGHSKWIPWLQIIVTVLLGILTVAAIPWIRWVTLSINQLETSDVSFKQWQSGRETVLKLQSKETLIEVQKMLDERLSKLEGQLNVMSRQGVDNGYEIRRLQEMLQFHLKDAKQPNTSFWNPGILQTNIYHVPGSSNQVGDDYAGTN